MTQNDPDLAEKHLAVTRHSPPRPAPASPRLPGMTEKELGFSFVRTPTPAKGDGGILSRITGLINSEKGLCWCK